MDMKILFRIQCVDEVALQAMLHQHSGKAAGKAQAGGCFENWRGVHGSSSSSGEEDKKSKSQEAEIKEVRAQVERLRRQKRRPNKMD